METPKMGQETKTENQKPKLPEEVIELIKSSYKYHGSDGINHYFQGADNRAYKLIDRVMRCVGIKFAEKFLKSLVK